MSMTETDAATPEAHGYHQCVDCGELTTADIDGTKGWLCKSCVPTIICEACQHMHASDLIDIECPVCNCDGG